MPKRKTSGVVSCVYCGLQPGVTRDHVIPRSLLPEKLPDEVELITVPVCDKCNNEKSKDDAFLRDVLSLDVHSEEHRGTGRARSKFVASAKRNSSEVARLLADATGPNPVFTKSGAHVGDYITTPIDPSRIDHIFTRIVRGLYWNAHNQRVPDTYEFEILRVLSPDVNDEIAKWEKIMGKPVFPATKAYFGQAHIFARTDPFLFVWLLVLYGGYVVIVQTSRNDSG